jgi:hypothetical protein
MREFWYANCFELEERRLSRVKQWLLELKAGPSGLLSVEGATQKRIVRAHTFTWLSRVQHVYLRRRKLETFRWQQHRLLVNTMLESGLSC